MPNPTRPGITIEARDASKGRVPSPPLGHAIVFRRYETESSVVLNPQDFHRLAALDDALSEVEQLVPSDLAVRVHQLEDTPGTPIEDAAEIDRILGL